MTLSRRDLVKISGTTAMAGLFTFQGRDLAAQSPEARMRIAINVADIQTLDPHFAVTNPDRNISDMVFNGLLRFTPGDSNSFEPDLATEMPTATSNDDGTQTWTFTLRDDVLVHAVEEVEAYQLTADDVIFSLEKVSNPDTSAFSGDYDGWTFDAPDDMTVNITLPFPISETLLFPRISNYSGGYIVPRVPYETLGRDRFSRQPVGTGPFIFSSHTPQNNVTLVANDDYFRGRPVLDSVEHRYISDNTARELSLLSRDIDAVYGLMEAQWVDRINAMDGFTVDVFGPGEVAFVCFDTQHEILQDVRVREAIVLAIDRDNHLALSGEPVAAPCYSVVPYDLMPGGLSPEEAEAAGVLFEPNLERARELLTDAGYPDGFELSLVTSEMTVYRSNYTVLAEELRQIGITVNLEVVQHPAMHELIRQGRNAIVIYNAFRPTADTYLSHFFISESGPTNFSRYNVDDLRERALREEDPDAQAELWKEANIELQANFAAIGLYYINQVWARADGVDYGHELVSMVQLYPGIYEHTSVTRT